MPLDIQTVKINNLPLSDTLSLSDLIVGAQNHHVPGQPYSNGSYAAKQFSLQGIFNIINSSLATYYLPNAVDLYDGRSVTSFTQINKLKFVGTNISISKTPSGVLEISVNTTQSNIIDPGKIEVSTSQDVSYNSLISAYQMSSDVGILNVEARFGDTVEYIKLPDITLVANGGRILVRKAVSAFNINVRIFSYYLDNFSNTNLRTEGSDKYILLPAADPYAYITLQKHNDVWVLTDTNIGGYDQYGWGNPPDQSYGRYTLTRSQYLVLTYNNLISSATGIATLNSDGLVIQNPASATITSIGASGQIPLTNNAGKIDTSYLPALEFEKYKEAIYDRDNPYQTTKGTTADDPYILGSQGETRLLIQHHPDDARSGETVFIKLPTTGIATDQRFEIDTSNTDPVVVFVDPTWSWTRTASRVVATLSDLQEVRGHKWNSTMHLMYEAYPDNSAWTVAGGDSVTLKGTSGSGDGWGNSAQLDINGNYLKRFTHSQAEMSLHLSEAQFSAVTGYFGTPVDISNVPVIDTLVLKKFALHASNSIAASTSIVLPASNSASEGDTYRFYFSNLLGQTITISALDSSAINFGDKSLAGIEIIGDSINNANDYFEFTLILGAWRGHSQNFLDYMAGLLPVSKVVGAVPMINDIAFVDNKATILGKGVGTDRDGVPTTVNGELYQHTYKISVTDGDNSLWMSHSGWYNNNRIAVKYHADSGLNIPLILDPNMGGTDPNHTINGKSTLELQLNDWVDIYAGANGSKFQVVAASRPELMGAARHKVHTVDVSEYGLGVTLTDNGDGDNVNGVYATWFDYDEGGAHLANTWTEITANENEGGARGWYYQTANGFASQAIWVPYAGTGPLLTDPPYLVGTNDETLLYQIGTRICNVNDGVHSRLRGVLQLDMLNNPIYQLGDTVTIINDEDFIRVVDAAYGNYSRQSTSHDLHFGLGNGWVIQNQQPFVWQYVEASDPNYYWAIISPEVFIGSNSFDCGWGNNITPNSKGVLQRFTLSEAQYSAVTGYFGTPVNYSTTGGFTIPTTDLFKLLIIGDYNYYLPETGNDGDTYRFLVTNVGDGSVGYGVGIFSGSSTIKTPTGLVSTVTRDTGLNLACDYLEFVWFGGLWYVHTQNFLDYMAGLLPWTKVDTTGSQIRDLQNKRLDYQVSDAAVFGTATTPVGSSEFAETVTGVAEGGMLSNCFLDFSQIAGNRNLWLSISSWAKNNLTYFNNFNNNGYTLTIQPDADESGTTINGLATLVLADGDMIGVMTEGSLNNFQVVTSNKPEFIGVSTLQLGNTSTTAYRGDYGETAYNHSQATHAPSNAEQNVQSDWSQTTDTSDDYIKNKPDLGLKADLVDGKVPTNQLPASLDTITEYDTITSFPASGASGVIYVALDTNISYRWSGTQYTGISSSLALGETSTSAYRGDRGKTAYDHSQTSHLALGTTSGTAYRGDYGQIAYDHSQTLHSYEASGSTAAHAALTTTAHGGILQLGETLTTAYRGDRGKTAYDHTSLTTTAHGGLLQLGSTGTTAMAGNATPTPAAHAASHILTGTDPLTINPWHGVVSRTTVSPLPTSNAGTFTLYCATTALQYYYKGKLVTVSSNKNVSCPDLTLKYFIYFADDTGTLSASTTFPDLFNNVLVATTTRGRIYDERHNHVRNIQNHIDTHEGIGTRYITGLDFGYAGTTNANTTFSIASGQINDEDIHFLITPKTTGLVWYQTGQNSWVPGSVTTLPYYAVSAVGGAGIYHTTNAYALASNNQSSRFFNFFIYGTTDVVDPIYILTETVSATTAAAGGYTSAANARLAPPPTLTGSNFSTEVKLLCRVVVNGAGLVQTPTLSDDYRSGGSIPGGGVATLSHDALSNVQLAGLAIPYGHISDLAQTIYGAKTFNDGIISSTSITGSITGNAETVTTNANLTGVITSTGNTTSIASQTGTGSKFVVDNGPTLINPILGTATGTSFNSITGLGSADPIMSSVAASGSSTLVSRQDHVHPSDTTKESTTNKDVSGGYAGLTLFKLNMRNVANTFTSWFTNTNSAARTYTLPDKDGTVAMTSDITGTNSGTNTGDNAVNSNYSGLVTNATHTGDATGSGALTVVAINGTNLASLPTGILKNTTGTGIPSIAASGVDYLTPTGSAASLTNFPTFNQNTSGSAATVTGASQTAITTLANLVSVGTITTGVWSGTDIAVADGGTGRSTGTTAYSLIATGTTATSAQQTLANGATTEILVGGGASALPVWTTAQGSGAPVRATSPSLTTPNIGAATATTLNSLTLTSQTTGFTIAGGTSSKTLTLDTDLTASTIFSNPMTAAGDLIIGGTSGAPTRLGLGAALKVLRVNIGGTGLEFGDAGSSGHTIQDEGVSQTARTKLNFVGSAVAVTDDSGNDTTIVTITGGLTNSATIQTSNFDATVFYSYFVSGGITATLPASASINDMIELIPINGGTGLVIARNGLKIMGLDEDLTIDVINAAIKLRYSDAANGWRIV